MSSRWRDALEAADLWTVGSPWTDELITMRAGLRVGLVLDRDELPLTVLALEAVSEEFADNWDEFCTVAPGGIEKYSVEPDGVRRLADRLRISMNG